MAVDPEIDGAQPSFSSRRGTEQGEVGDGTGSYLPAAIDGGEGAGRWRRSGASGGQSRRRRR